MLSGADTLASVPDFVSVASMLKANPVSDGGRRYVYFEASNEGNDQQNEVILAKALNDSKDLYLQHGNVDLEHYTQIGARLGIPNYSHYEIGQPVEVGQRAGSTFVKAELYQGEGPMAANAAMVWDSLTKLRPQQRWYPSVGGAVLAKSFEVDPKTQARKAIIGRVRWTNVGLSKTPVNQHVGICQSAPIGIFAKCFSALDGSIDMSMLKTLTAGYGTDSGSLEGGAALREQSLDKKLKDTSVGSYFEFRNRLADSMRADEIQFGADPAALSAFAATKFSLSHDEAAEYVERFLRDVETALQKRNKP